MNKTIIAMSLFALSGCASTGAYERNLNSWIGAPADELITDWGPPDREYPLSNGGRILEFADVRKGGVSFCHPSRPICIDREVNRSCYTRFAADEKGILRDWSSEGNCPS